MIKSFAKRGYWADQMELPWSDMTKPSIGVTMVQVSQVPKWNSGIMPIKRRGNGSGSTKPPSDSVALGRSRGVTGSDLTMPPSDLVAFAYQKASHWFGHDQGPKWYHKAFVEKQISRGKPEAAWKQNHSM